MVSQRKVYEAHKFFCDEWEKYLKTCEMPKWLEHMDIMDAYIEELEEKFDRFRGMF